MNMPITLHNNEATTAKIALQAQKLVAFELVWIKPNIAGPSNIEGRSKIVDSPPPTTPPFLVPE